MQIFLFFNNTKQILIIYQMFQTYLSMKNYKFKKSRYHVNSLGLFIKKTPWMSVILYKFESVVLNSNILFLPLIKLQILLYLFLNIPICSKTQ